MRLPLLLSGLIPLLAAAFPAQAAVHKLGPGDDWFALLHGGGLKPGDEVVLAAGTYSDRRRLEMNHRGIRGNLITIRAAEGAKVVLKRPDARQNTINMNGCQYLVLRGIEITGGDAAIRIAKQGEHMAKFILLEGLHIHHIGGVAVTANNEGNTYEKLVFRGNHIHHTGGHGEGFYLGCNNAKDGSTPGYVFDSIVEGNYIHDLKDGTVSQGDGVEIKDGSYANIVRDNVIHDTKYPGVIVYGTDGKAPNIIERNVIWNTGDSGIQAAADAVIRDNVIFDFGGDGIHCRTHQSAEPGDLSIQNNTIVSRGRGGNTAIRTALPEGGKYDGPVTVSNNALYAPIALRIAGVDQVEIVGNKGDGSVAAGKLDAAEWKGGQALPGDFLAPVRDRLPEAVRDVK